MREWRATIDAVDERTAEAIDTDCSPSRASRSRCRMSSTAAPSSSRWSARWRGTRIPPPVAARARAARPPVRVTQEVRLRILRTLQLSAGLSPVDQPRGRGLVARIVEPMAPYLAALRRVSSNAERAYVSTSSPCLISM